MKSFLESTRESQESNLQYPAGSYERKLKAQHQERVGVKSVTSRACWHVTEE